MAEVNEFMDDEEVDITEQMKLMSQLKKADPNAKEDGEDLLDNEG